MKNKKTENECEWKEKVKKVGSSLGLAERSMKFPRKVTY